MITNSSLGPGPRAEWKAEIEKLYAEYQSGTPVLNGYTDPELRAKLKDKILAGDKGGKPGEWSARKSQLLVLEYEKAGGDYIGPKTDKAKSLTKWSKEDWKTIDGKPAIRFNKSGQVITKRYLPAKAWDNLSAAEKLATDRKKQKGNGQYVPNTAASRTAKP